MRQLKINKMITVRGDFSLDKYLREIGEEELITAEEEVVLAQKIKKGDQAALEKLTKANLRFVVSVAKQYQNQGLGLPDLIEEGNLGLIKAAQKFDETRGFKFISYAVWWIRQMIIQAISEQARIVRLPQNHVSSITKINKAISGLEQKLGRSPTAEEIAEVTKIPEKKVQDSMRVSGRHISLDSSFQEEEEYGLLNILENKSAPSPDDELIKDSLKLEIKRAFKFLTDREAKIIIYFFGLDTGFGLTLDEIGEKLELTRERVRQIKEKAIRKLKHFSRSKILKTYLG